MVSAKLKVAVLYDIWGEEEEALKVEEKVSAKKKKKPRRAC